MSKTSNFNPFHLKKSLGQHFLKDKQVLLKISDAIGNLDSFKTVIEVGPGQGALTKYIAPKNHSNYHLIELDKRWAAYLIEAYPLLAPNVHEVDFLRYDLTQILQNPTHLIGNFPYNISSQIIFKMIDHHTEISMLTGMFQKEVALRLSAKTSTKDYGVLSLLTQAYYDCEYLFDVLPTAFDPPPKVMSGVIRLTHRTESLKCDEKKFKQLIKQAFTMRRKTMRNSLKPIIPDINMLQEKVFDRRPEELTVADFEDLTNFIFPEKK